MHARLNGAALAVLYLIAVYAAYCVSPWLGGLAAVTLAILAFLYGPVCSPAFWGRLTLAALVLILTFVQPADARKRHKHHHRHHHAHVIKRVAPVPAAVVSPMVDDRYANLRAPEAYGSAMVRGYRAFSGLAARAGQYLGTNPTGWARVWCGKFLRLIVPRDPGPAYDVARNWKHYGAPAHGPVAGAIGVMPHHVGIVLGRCEGGGVLLRSGNHRKRVGDGCYSAARFIAFRV